MKLHERGPGLNVSVCLLAKQTRGRTQPDTVDAFSIQTRGRTQWDTVDTSLQG